MKHYKRILEILIVASPLINFSLLQGSKVPLFYLIGFATLAVFLVIDRRVSTHLFGLEDLFFLGFLLLGTISWFLNKSQFSSASGLTQLINHCLTYILFKFCIVLLFKVNADPTMMMRKYFRIMSWWAFVGIAIHIAGIIYPKWLIAFAALTNNSGNFSVGAIGESLATARSFGVGPEPSFWSFLLAMNLSVALIIPRPAKTGVAVTVLNLLLTLGRTGILITLSILIIKFAKSSPAAKLLLIFIVTGLVLVGFDYFEFAQLATVDASFEQRIGSLFKAADVIAANPFFGIGLGNFKDFAIEHELPFADVFNLFLSVFVGSGLLGAFCYWAMLGAIFFRMERKYDLPFYAAIIGWLTVSAYNLPFVWILFAILIHAKNNYSGQKS